MVFFNFFFFFFIEIHNGNHSIWWLGHWSGRQIAVSTTRPLTQAARLPALVAEQSILVVCASNILQVILNT